MGFHNSFLKHQILACSYLKVGLCQPWGGEGELYFGSECIFAPSWQLHTITVSHDIYLKSIALFKFFCVCHSTMDMLCEIVAWQTKLLLTAWISCPPYGVGERLFLPCVFLSARSCTQGLKGWCLQPTWKRTWVKQLNRKEKKKILFESLLLCWDWGWDRKLVVLNERKRKILGNTVCEVCVTWQEFIGSIHVLT